jgi:hypothetical protein
MRRLIALVLLALASEGVALANGKPIQIVLSYAPDSYWPPQAGSATTLRGVGAEHQ